MKVLFIPQYFYLNLPSFTPVKQELERGGHKCVLARLKNNTPVYINDDFTNSKLHQLGWDIVNIPVVLVANYRRKILDKIRLFMAAIKNRGIIKRFLVEQAPDAIVLGSDLGGVNHRLVIDVCSKVGIPIVILYTCQVPQLKVNKQQFSIVTRFFLSLFGLDGAVTFDGDIPGSYAVCSKVLVTSDVVKQRLLESGIDVSRILVVGDPADDSADIIEGGQKCSQGNILSPNKEEKMVVYISEALSYIYGEHYEIDIVKRLASICSGLDGIKLFIKPHPRESEEVLKGYTKIASEYSCVYFDRQTKLNDLFLAANLMIGHFSKALLSAIKRDIPIACIDLGQDEVGFGFKAEFGGILQISSYEQLGVFLRKFSENDSFCVNLRNAAKSVLKRFCAASDVGSTQIVVEEILNIVSFDHKF